MDNNQPPVSDLPAGFQLDLNQPEQPQALPPVHQEMGDVPPGFELVEEKYGSTGQQAIAGLEGVGKGLLGPIAPAIERGLGVDPEGIRGRAEANPVTHGIGEAAGLIGGLAVPGGGQAGLLTKVGRGAQELAGLAKVAEGASVAHKIGSIAVQQAAEMAVYQSGDEVAKYILNDPDQTAETAISNIGLATALGTGVGAGFGSISPLWKATVGPKFEKVLTGLREHLDGGGKLKLPEEIEAAQKTLGIEISPATRAGMSGDPKATKIFNELREVKNDHIVNDIKALETASADSVSRSLGVDAADIAGYNEADLGHNLRDSFLKEYKTKYGPISEQQAAKDAIADTLPISDDAKLKLYGDLLEQGINKVGTDSPFYKKYHEYGNRILAKDTLGGLDKLSTEIRQSAQTLGKDINEKQVLNDIQAKLRAFKDEQIISQSKLGYGPGDFAKQGADVLAARDLANKGYREFAEMSDKLMSHLGSGEFKGYKGLVDKLKDSTPEALLRKFSFKGDAELIPFLKTHFPETFEIVRQNEIKKLIKPAVLAAKDGSSINIQKLASIVEKGMAGEKSYIESVLPQEALNKIEAAKELMAALPKPTRSVDTMLSKAYKSMPANVMAAIGWAMGDVTGGVSGYLFGSMAQHLGKGIPESLKLSLLKFLGAEQPVQAAGFKAMVDMISHTYKGARALDTATGNLFRPTIRVLTDSQMPTTRQIEKIDKMVAAQDRNPQAVFDESVKQSDVAYYMPLQQVSISKTSSNALTYLSSIKPKPFKPGPLDKAIEPSTQEKDRYNRALHIAQQPNIVLQHIKDGTIVPSDMIDLKSMYPALYTTMVNKVSSQMVNKQSEESPIPYKTKVGLSLFLGQPIDFSMTPQAIIKAQPIHKPEEMPQPIPSGRKPASNSFKKLSSNTMTAVQGAAASRQTRD